MSTDDRAKKQNDENEPGTDDQPTIKDLQAEPLTEDDAKEVKGGGTSFNDLHFTKVVDKSSPNLF